MYFTFIIECEVSMPLYYKSKESFQNVPVGEITRYITLAQPNELKVVLALTWLTGSRITEVISLTKGNIVIDDVNRQFALNYKALKHGKQAMPSFNYNDPFVEEIIVPYVNSYKDTSFKLFTKSKRWYQQKLYDLNKRIYSDNKFNWITFHYLRHSRITFLTRTLLAQPDELKSWTGHSSTAFEVYLQPRKVDRFRGRIE